MSLRLKGPHPILAPGHTYSTRNHTRTPSRASPNRPRITDDLLSDLSPATTLAAFTASSSSSGSKLRASIEAASAAEREFGIRAATAANKIKEWVNELKDWPWPRSGSAGFEDPIAQRRKLLNTEKRESSSRNATRISPGELNSHHESSRKGNDLQEDLYCGSLYAQDVIKYSIRIDEILDDMEDLDVGGIQSHILDLHIPGRSRPSSSASASTAPPSFSYTKLDDFTAVITATVLQALPYLARLRILMDAWELRLSVLGQIKPLFDALKDAEAAVRSGWQVLDFSKPGNTSSHRRNNDESKAKQQYLTRAAFNTMQTVLQSKITQVGQKIDHMLDSLEGKQDTLPNAWLDRMEALEQQYADWTALANRKVLEGEWVEQNSSRKDTEKHHSQTAEVPHLSSAIDKKPQPLLPAISNDSEIRNEVQDRDISHEQRVSIGGSSLTTITPISRNNHLKISPFDGGRENLEEMGLAAGSEPITPQTPSFDISHSFRSEAENIFPSTPPSSKSSPAAKLSPARSITDHEKRHIDLSNDDSTSEVFGLEYSPSNKADLKTQMVGHLNRIDEQSSPENQKCIETKELKTKANKSCITPQKYSNGQLCIATLAKSTTTSPSTPRISLNETPETKNSFLDFSEAPSDSSLLQSVLSTGSNYDPSEMSPTANRGISSQHARRALSTIQSSADLFDRGDEVKTPTKDALRENSNASNLFHSNEDGQKTPTRHANSGTPGDSGLYHQRPDDYEYDSDNDTTKENLITDEASTPTLKDHPILSFDEASPEGALPLVPAVSKQKKSLQLLDSPDFSTPLQIPEIPREAPVLPNVDVLEAPALFSPTKGPADQLQQQISEILQSLPTRIHLTTESEKNTFPDIQIPKKRREVKKTSSASSLRLPSRSPTPTPSFTLAPAYSKNSPRLRHQNANPEIKLYHLSRSNGGAPIKLFVRLVGENGERVMVRVGGGWADLGEYLREYAIHHSRRNAPEDKIHIHDSSSRIVSSSSISAARNGRSSPIGRSVSPMESRPATSMGNRRTSTQTERPGSSLTIRKTRDPRKSIGEDTRQAQQRFPSTPIPVVNRTRRGTSVPRQETPPSAASTTSRSSSRLSHNGEDSFLGLSGPRSKHVELSEENERWVESMTEKVKQASAEKERKEKVILGDMGKVGSTKRLFRKN